MKLNEAYDEYVLEKGIQESGKDLKGYTNRTLKEVQKKGAVTKKSVRKAFKTTPFSFARYQSAIDTSLVVAPIVHYVTQPKGVRTSDDLAGLRNQIGRLSQEGGLDIKNPQQTVDRAFAIVQGLNRNEGRDKFPTFSRFLDSVQDQRQLILDQSAKRLAKEIPMFNKTITESIVRAYQDAVDSGQTKIDALVSMVGETQYKSNIALRNFLHREFHADYERVKINTADFLGFNYKYWRTQRDGRVRHSHMIMDGKIVKNSERFKLGSHKAMYPGDPSLPIEEAVNCRCFTESAFVPRGTRKGYELPLSPPSRGAAGSVLPIASLVDEIDKLTPYTKTPVTEEGVYAHFTTPREDVKIPYSKDNAEKLGTFTIATRLYNDGKFTRTLFEAGLRFNQDNLSLLDAVAKRTSSITSREGGRHAQGVSHFSAYRQELYLDYTIPKTPTEYHNATKTLFHELGHAADHYGGWFRPNVDFGEVFRSKKYRFTLDRDRLPKNWSYKARTDIVLYEQSGKGIVRSRYERRDKQEFGYSLANMAREEAYEFIERKAKQMVDPAQYEQRYKNDPIKVMKDKSYRIKEMYADDFPEMLNDNGLTHKEAILTEMDGFFDVLGGAFGGKIFTPFGHTQQYWAKRKDTLNDVLNKEIVANFFEAETTQAYGIKAIKKVFPKTYEIFQEYKQELKKRL